MPSEDPGDPLGSLSDLLRQYMDEHPDLSERQIAERCGLPQQTFRKIRMGNVVRPLPKTLDALNRGTGIPVRVLREAAARNVDESYVIEDISSDQALRIAIARIGEVPDEELPDLVKIAQEAVREIKARQAGRATGK